MRAYLYDNIEGDQRDEHDSGTSVSLSDLEKIGVKYYHISASSDVEAEAALDDIARQRDYKNRDVINVSKAGLKEAYEAKILMFFEEHLHEDEEIRYINDGSGFFDVRNDVDQWIRIKTEKGDLLILPAGIYHRFTLDHGNFIKATRLFKEEPKWTPINRPADNNSFRKEYLNSIKAN